MRLSLIKTLIMRINVCFDMSIIMNDRLSNELINECAGIIHKIEGDTPQGAYLKDLFEKVIDAFKTDDKTVVMEIPAYITLMFSYLIKNSFVDIKRTNFKQRRES